MCGSEEEIILFRQLSDSFDHGPVECVAENHPIVYCGLTLAKAGRPYAISQDSCRENAHLLRVDDFIGAKRKFTTPEMIKKAANDLSAE